MSDSRYSMEPIGPELGALISAADEIDGPNAETRSRLYKRLAATLALPTILAAPAVVKAGGVAKAVAAVTAAKPVILSVLLFSGIGLIGYAGYRVSNAAKDTAPSAASTATNPSHESGMPQAVNSQM
ncbi:MAG: hypothetical protein JXX14_11745, partial [Deltaproteobacteria bacterium]|nr:hypothetical protein [Deltaproteobacteria bacterium]